jgi:hypothetical protein
MGRFLGAVCANFAHNLMRAGDEPIYFERTVVSDDDLSLSGRDKFLALAQERGQELLVELDTFLTQLSSSEKASSGKKYGIGVYFFEEDSKLSPESRTERPLERRISDRPSQIEEIDVLAVNRRKE